MATSILISKGIPAFFTAAALQIAPGQTSDEMADYIKHQNCTLFA
ncbi:hypothetical protein [Undibacterium sp. KW1]|nr:hypothetical protein [Undibacterium sp. KW1]